MLYQIVDGTLSVGSETVLSHFNFEIKGRDRIAIVGPNGAGKTTLLRLIAGELELDRDDKLKAPAVRIARSTTIGMLHQQAFSDLSRTVQEEIMAVCPYRDTWERERFDFEQEYDRILTGLGFDKEDKKKCLSEFSGGQQTKLGLIRLLLEKPDILLLDEPTNHLDMETVGWLEQYLRSYPKAIVLVSHDRFFLDEVAEIIYELKDGRLTRYVGNYTTYKAQKVKKIELQKKHYESQQAELKRLNELIERFKHKPNKAAMARSKKKMIERMAPAEKPETMEGHFFTGEMLPAVRGPKWVLEAEKLVIGYDIPLLELSLRIRRGQKIGIIGPNGAGKSTFLKTAAEKLQPLSGKCKMGEQVEMGYFDQLSAGIESQDNVIDHFKKLYPSVIEKDARSFLAAYLFEGADAGKKVASLSGGEKSRLLLCEMLYALPNFLIMDEPTNHMDITAKETLESAFRAYKGTILFVSHDRYFISEVADALLIFENGRAFYYPFDYRHYLRYLQKEADRQKLSAEMPEEERKSLPVDQSLTLISTEDQVLISGLQNVPKGSNLLGHELSTEQAFLDWQQRLAYEAMSEQAEIRMAKENEQYEKLLKTLSDDQRICWEFWEGIAEKEDDDPLLEAELKWFEIWQEGHMSRD